MTHLDSSVQKPGSTSTELNHSHSLTELQDGTQPPLLSAQFSDDSNGTAKASSNPSGNAPFFVDNEVIVLNKNGIWIADGSEITHEPTRRLFAKSLRKHTDDNAYYLHIGRETKKILVEDTAYFVLRIDGDLKSGYELLLSDDTREKLDPRTLTYRPGRLTCKVHSASEEAKFLHASYFDLLQHLQEDSSSYFLEFGSPGEGKERILLSKK